MSNKQQRGKLTELTRQEAEGKRIVSFMHTYMHTYKIHIYIDVYIHVYIYAYIQT